MFSEMLREMDRNTIRYMVDDMKEQIEKGKVEYAELQEKMAVAREALLEKNKALAEKDAALQAQAEEIARLQALLKNK